MHALTTRRVPEIRFSVNPYADKAAVGVVAEPLRGVAALADLANRANRQPSLTTVEPNDKMPG